MPTCLFTGELSRLGVPPSPKIKGPLHSYMRKNCSCNAKRRVAPAWSNIWGLISRAMGKNSSDKSKMILGRERCFFAKPARDIMMDLIHKLSFAFLFLAVCVCEKIPGWKSDHTHMKIKWTRKWLLDLYYIQSLHIFLAPFTVVCKESNIRSIQNSHQYPSIFPLFIQIHII